MSKQNQNKNQKITNPHDRFFRGAMSDPEVALSFIEEHLPPHIVAQIDLDSLKLTQGTFIDEELREFITDVTYQATFCGDPGYIYFLAEHQRKSEPMMPLRLFEYILKICRRHLLEHEGNQLPLVYPCVIYNGKEPYCHTTDIFELFGNPQLAREIFLKPFQLIDLTQASDDELKKHSLIGMVEMLLKHAFARDMVSLVQQTMAAIIEELVAKNKSELFTLSIQYLLKTQEGQLSRSDVINLFQPYLSLPTQTKIMTIAESLIEEGRREGRQESMTIAESLIEEGLQQGLQQGHQEGRQEGFRDLIEMQIRRRFSNTVTANHLRLIAKADSDTLSHWGEKLIDAESIEEIFEL